MKHGTRAVQRNAHSGPTPFGHFCTEGYEQRFNVAPGNIGAFWTFVDGFQCLLMPCLHCRL